MGRPFCLSKGVNDVSAFVVRTVWKNWKLATELAKVEHLTPHQAMRHTFATWAHNVLGMSANDIAAAGYWSAGSIPMLQKVYIHSDKTSDDVANAMAAKRRVAMLNGGAEQKKEG
jgi:integrase